MTESATLWLFGTVITVLGLVIGGIVGWIFAHSKDCLDFRVATAASLAAIVVKLDRVIDDIGDHESGLRGSVHKLRNDISPYMIRAQGRDK